MIRVSTENWKCTACQHTNPAGAPLCIRCQASPAAPAPEPARPRRRYPLWIASLPAIFFSVHAMVQFSRVAQNINPDAGASLDTSRLSCVETYGITLNLSEYYVREWAMGIPAKSNNQTPELSTVLKGMARNGCGEDLKNVRIRFVVHDDAGRKGEGSYLIESLASGEVKSFERAWMGRLTSYDVAAAR